MCAPVPSELLLLAEKPATRHGSDRVELQFTAIIEAEFAETVLPFDDRAARICAFTRAQQVVRARTRAVVDVMIAAICMTNRLPLATRNVKDFEGPGLDIVGARAT